MKYYVNIVLAMIAYVSIPAFAEPGWINISISADNESRWDAQPGSLEFSKTKGGTPIASVIGRISNTRTSRIDLFKWYVSATDCKRKMGNVVSLSIGGEFLFENDFVFGSGNIASAMAETICAAADYGIRETAEKSL